MKDKEGLFRPASRRNEDTSSGQLFRKKEGQSQSRVAKSINRINAAARGLDPGWYGTLRLSPYRQQEGTTCFFSGPIAVARDFYGVMVTERPLAERARRLGLLNVAGARTAEEGKRLALESFVKKETGVTIRFHEHSWGDQEEDLKIFDILVKRGNLASVLYPITDETHEWETFFGIDRIQGKDGTHWHSNFSPAGVIKERTTPQMAHLLYGKPKNSYLLICEIQVQTSL